MAKLYLERFEPEHVRLLKPATQAGYDAAFRNHIGPLLGDLPLSVIDEDRLSVFRATMAGRFGPVAANLVIQKVTKLLRFAKEVRLIAVRPELKRLPVPRPRPKVVYNDAQIKALLGAARSIDPTCELTCLLALDAGLRTSEVCALEWGDLDLDAGTILVQHNQYRGQIQTPKGTIGKLALTKALWKALAAHRSGIRRLIAPKVNDREYDVLPARVRDEIDFFFVQTMDEVIECSFLNVESDDHPVDSDQLVSTRLA